MRVRLGKARFSLGQFCHPEAASGTSKSYLPGVLAGAPRAQLLSAGSQAGPQLSLACKGQRQLTIVSGWEGAALWLSSMAFRCVSELNVLCVVSPHAETGLLSKTSFGREGSVLFDMRSPVHGSPSRSGGSPGGTAPPGPSWSQVLGASSADSCPPPTLNLPFNSNRDTVSPTFDVLSESLAESLAYNF